MPRLVYFWSGVCISDRHPLKGWKAGFAGAASFSVSCEQTWLGFFMFVTAISFRMVALDFSIAGSLASGLALLFAIPSMFLALWWTVHG